MKRNAAWVLFLWLISVGVSHGQINLVDFDNTATKPRFGGTWNTIPTPTGSTALLRSTGAASTPNGDDFNAITNGWTNGSIFAGIASLPMEVIKLY